MTYQVFTLDMENITVGVDREDFVAKWLNEKVKAGWELVCFLRDTDWQEATAAFKRYAPLPEPKYEVQEVKDLFGDMESI